MKSKKIRGLRRRCKEIDKWFLRNQFIDLDGLNKYHYWYAKAKVHPWSNLYNLVPYPPNYRKLLFSNLLDIFFNWKQQLELSGYNFRLEVWFYDSDFINSQVVASIEERKERYADLYPPIIPPKPFPVQMFQNETSRIETLNWKYSEDFNYFFESEFENLEDYYHDDKEYYFSQKRFYKQLLKRGKFKMITNNRESEERLFFVKNSDVWIGQVLSLKQKV